MTEKTETADQLNDTDLANASGGVYILKEHAGTEGIFISTVTQVGTLDKHTKVITYRPCPRCGKPMHTEWYVSKWYCDPCNFSEYRPRKETWNGTKEELIAAAK